MLYFVILTCWLVLESASWLLVVVVKMMRSIHHQWQPRDHMLGRAFDDDIANIGEEANVDPLLSSRLRT